jgi:hypothetical protein
MLLRPLLEWRIFFLFLCFLCENELIPSYSIRLKRMQFFFEIGEHMISSSCVPKDPKTWKAGGNSKTWKTWWLICNKPSPCAVALVPLQNRRGQNHVQRQRTVTPAACRCSSSPAGRPSHRRPGAAALVSLFNFSVGSDGWHMCSEGSNKRSSSPLLSAEVAVRRIQRCEASLVWSCQTSSSLSSLSRGVFSSLKMIKKVL